MGKEYETQKAYFQWVDLQAKSDPKYSMISSTQNGAHLAHGAFSFNKLKAAGFRNGFPDIMVLLPNELFHGLFIELKIKPNKLSLDQEQWIGKLYSWGYQAVVCWSLDELIDTTKAYMVTVKKFQLTRS